MSGPSQPATGVAYVPLTAEILGPVAPDADEGVARGQAYEPLFAGAAPCEPKLKKARKPCEDFTWDMYYDAVDFMAEMAKEDPPAAAEPGGKWLRVGRKINLYGINDAGASEETAQRVTDNLYSLMRRKERDLKKDTEKGATEDAEEASTTYNEGKALDDKTEKDFIALNAAVHKTKEYLNESRILKLNKETHVHKFHVENHSGQSWAECVTKLSKVQQKVGPRNSFRWVFGEEKHEDLRFSAQGYEKYPQNHQRMKETKKGITKEQREEQMKHTCVLQGEEVFFKLIQLYPALGPVITRCLKEANLEKTSAKLERAHLLFQKSNTANFGPHRDHDDNPKHIHHRISMVVYLGGGTSRMRVVGKTPVEYTHPGDVNCFMSRCWHETMAYEEGAEGAVKLTLFFSAWKK